MLLPIYGAPVLLHHQLLLNTAGTYTVTVADANGCTSSCNKTVIPYTPPTCAITGNVLYCAGGSTQICAPAGLAGYLWNTGATTQCITVTAGDYTVTVTDGNGCTSFLYCQSYSTSASELRYYRSGAICTGSSAQWCAAAAPVGYTYTYYGVQVLLPSVLLFSTAGTRTVTVTDQYGCSKSCQQNTYSFIHFQLVLSQVTVLFVLDTLPSGVLLQV